MNVTSVYNLQNGEFIIAYDNKKKEEKYLEMERNNLISIDYINDKADEIVYENAMEDYSSLEYENNNVVRNMYGSGIDLGDIEDEEINF